MSWKIDTSHTQIQFSVRHMMISKVRGSFEKFEGTVELDETNPAKTTVEVRVDAASVNTREPNRDAHLRSADFFNAEVFPYLIFKSKRVEVMGTKNAKLTGDLTIRDITREASLNVEYLGTSKNPFNGAVSAGFTGTGIINRKEWNLNWNQLLETGGVLVGEEIELSVELELVQQA